MDKKTGFTIPEYFFEENCTDGVSNHKSLHIFPNALTVKDESSCPY